MKILHVTTSYPRFRGDYPGIFNFRLDRELVKRGIDVHVLAPGASEYPAQDRIDGVRITRVPYFYPSRFQGVAYGDGIKSNLSAQPWVALQIPLLAVLLFIHLLWYGRKADVIHCHWAPMGLLGLASKPFLKKPVVLTLWGTDYRDLPTFFWRFVCLRVDAVISVATETEKYLHRIGMNGYKTIRTLIDEEEYNPENLYEDILVEYPLRGKRIVCFVGRLIPIKGPEVLVEAAPHVLKQIDDVVFLIVGDGHLQESLKQRASELGVRDAFIFTGARTDVAKFLKWSTLFTAVSPVENTWSNTIAEAMFMRVPLILSDAGYTREFFTDDKDCLLVPPGNPVRLAEAICHLLRSLQLREKLVSGADSLLDTSGKRSETIIPQTVSLYSQLIHKD